ncbi:MAG: ABC transporter ATP-binding protein [Acetivibrionales bacterium]|jgi:oligopeptide/dipeptide ABC transporter ATP-binding protein
MSKEALLSVKNLKVSFFGEYGEVKAVNDISFDIYKGESVGLVGKSGCGKSVTSLSIMGLLQTPARKQVTGEIIYGGINLLELNEKEMLKLRGKDIGMIFQDPMTSLNPLMKIGEQIAEALTIHFDIIRKEALKKSVELIKAVGIPRAEEIANDYPHQLSGGMRQRIMIAIAMACEPKMLIADEPTTALDVTIQAQIMALIKELIEKKQMSMLLITHDLGVVAESCDRVIVMYAGHIVEEADISEIFDNPVHPYTKGLLKAIPRLDEGTEKLYSIPGTVPNNLNMPIGCPFAPRCDCVSDKCMDQNPQKVECSPGHFVKCWGVKNV